MDTTLDKVQGLSLDAAVIDLGPKVFEDGMAYVALSRMRTLEGVALLGLVSEKVKASESAGLEMEQLRSNVLVAAVVNAREEGESVS